MAAVASRKRDSTPPPPSERAERLRVSREAPEATLPDGSRLPGKHVLDADQSPGAPVPGGSDDGSDCLPSISKEWTGSLLGVREQRAIAVVLLVTAAMFIVVPTIYCWLDQGRAEMADKYRGTAHGIDDDKCYKCQQLDFAYSHNPRNQPVLQVRRDFINEVANGGINGLLMMVATVLGGIGADIPGRNIFAMGTASLAAYGFSMGFGTFLVESVKEDFAVGQLAEEYQEVREVPNEEIREMVCHYRQQGLSEEDAKTVAGILSRYEDFWVRHMMSEELGIQLPKGRDMAVKSGLATGASFFFFGATPLLGLCLSLLFGRTLGPQWYRPQFSTIASLALSASVLLLLATFLCRVVGSRTPIINGLFMLANGCFGSLLAFLLSQAFAKLCRCAEVTAEPVSEERHGSQAEAASNQTSYLLRPDSELKMTSQEDGTAWPSFKSLFLRGLCALWVFATTAIVGVQLVKRVLFVEHMAVEALRVFAYGWLTCITTGLGAVPFLFTGAAAVGDVPLALANAAASGMMLAASTTMVMEAHEHCGPLDWQIVVGLVAGALFICASERLHSGDADHDEEIVALHKVLVDRRRWKKAVLIFTVMFCHSAAEGVAVGVAFSRKLNQGFGIYVSLLLAVHNVPEGLAVALVLVPRGVSTTLTVLIAVLTSVPQPLLALASFLFVDAFQWLLPMGLSFAAGAMVYLCLKELLTESAEHLGWLRALGVTALSFVTMAATVTKLQSLTDS